MHTVHNLTEREIKNTQNKEKILNKKKTIFTSIFVGNQSKQLLPSVVMHDIEILKLLSIMSNTSR